MKYLQSCSAKKKASTKQKAKLHNYAHTRKRMFPSVVITVTEGNMFRFQPSE